MINVEVNLVMNRPIADVFAFVANFENLPKGDPDYHEVKKLTFTPGGVGTTYQCLNKFQTPTVKLEVAEYAVNQKISYESEATGTAKVKGSI